jgi:hypothetical protein
MGFACNKWIYMWCPLLFTHKNDVQFVLPPVFLCLFLRYLCLFVHSSMFLLLFIFGMCLVCQFLWIVHCLIAPSVFSNVYIQYMYIAWKFIIYLWFDLIWFDLLYLTPLSAIFQLYHLCYLCKQVDRCSQFVLICSASTYDFIFHFQKIQATPTF